METKFQTSFIPKTSIDTTATALPRRHMGFFTFISLIIFFLSALSAGGMYMWHKYLIGSEQSLKESLDRNIKSFESQTIEEYVRLNNRIDAAKYLLSHHVAISYIFDFLSEKTIKSVRFLDLKYDVGVDGVATLTMNGEAKSYNAVAYQSEVFGKEKSLKSPLFSNLDLDTVGNVVFNFTTKIDPSFIFYTRKANTVRPSDRTGIESLPSSNNPSLRDILPTTPSVQAPNTQPSTSTSPLSNSPTTR